MRASFIFRASRLLKKVGVDFHAERNPAILAMNEKIHELGSIDFKIEIHPDGSWSAEATNIDGIITGGTDAKEIDATIKDAIFTYFKVPPYYADDAFLRAPNEPVIIKQRVWATR